MVHGDVPNCEPLSPTGTPADPGQIAVDPLTLNAAGNVLIVIVAVPDMVVVQPDVAVTLYTPAPTYEPRS